MKEKKFQEKKIFDEKKKLRGALLTFTYRANIT